MTTPDPDARHLSTGRLIPTRSYCDQPYVVITDDGAWLVCVTTGAGHEGAVGQHVTTMRSTDQGVTWSTPAPVEASINPENSYAVMLKVPAGRPRAGRVYIFYNHNTDNVRQVLSHVERKPITRVDSLGHYVFKFSDDGGRTWSPRRYPIPVREFACDRLNSHGGAIRFFWNVGRPFVLDGAAYVPLIKVGQFGAGFFSQSEGVLLRSENLLDAIDPAQVRWETLPDGDVGLRTPAGGGPIAEEQSYVVLSDGSIGAVYRTVDGYPCESYSRDGGRTWSPPRYRRMADGRVMKHPRAATFHWRCGNGKYLYWWHNHGGRFIGEHPRRLDIAYEDRNPAWLSAGVEIDTPTGREIAWSQPEIVLYDDDPHVRMSYPDLIEEGGRYFITETQKAVARVHELDRAMLEGMWATLEATLTRSSASGKAAFDPVIREALNAQRLLSLGGGEGGAMASEAAMPGEAPMPELPRFCERDWKRPDYGTRSTRAGFTIEMSFTLGALDEEQILIDSRDDQGRGLAIATTRHAVGGAGDTGGAGDAGGSVELILNDGHCECRWSCDPVLRVGVRHHLVAIVDAGPRIISFVIDGQLGDGGGGRQFGWGRFSPTLYHANGAPTLRIAHGQAASSARIDRLCLYGRALKTFEAVALWLAIAAGCH